MRIYKTSDYQEQLPLSYNYLHVPTPIHVLASDVAILYVANIYSFNTYMHIFILMRSTDIILGYHYISKALQKTS